MPVHAATQELESLQVATETWFTQDRGTHQTLVEVPGESYMAFSRTLQSTCLHRVMLTCYIRSWALQVTARVMLHRFAPSWRPTRRPGHLINTEKDDCSCQV